MENELSIAFIGDGCGTAARASRQARRVCAARGVHVIDINQDARAPRPRGTRFARAFAERSARIARGVFAAATRNMPGVVARTRQCAQEGAVNGRSAGGRRQPRLAPECAQ